MKFYAFVLLACFSALQVKGQALAGGAGVCKTTGDPDNILSMQTQNQEYGCSIAFDTVNSVVYVYDATAPMGSRWEVYAPSGSGGGIWQVQNSTSLAADNTSNNYHRGSIGIGDFSSTTIGASFHLYSPNMTMRLSDSCSTDQCATPLLEFYRGRSTSLLGRVGYLSSSDNDFSFINNLAAGKLKFGTDATVKLELLASGQARLNQYTSSTAFTGTTAGYLAFDANGYLITDSGTGGNTSFAALSDTPGSYTGQSGQYVRVNATENGLEFAAVAGGGASTFTGLSDTPASLSGEGSKYVRVNAGGTALEFATVAPGGGGGYPAVQVPNDSLTLRYDFGGQEEGLFKVNMGTRDRWEVVPSNPASGVAAEYSLMFTEVGLNDTVTFPEAFLYVLDSMPIGSINLKSSLIQDFWYDGQYYWTYGSLGNSLIGVPACSDGVQNGDETGVDCGGSCPSSCGGGGPGYDADYQAILDYATTQGYTLPSQTVRDSGNAFVEDLKAIGVWDSLDVLYVFATDGGRDFAKINWKDPDGNYNCTEVNSPTFTANEGFKGNGTSSYLNTNLNLNADSASLNFSADRGQIYMHLNETWPAASAACGARLNATVDNDQQVLIQNNASNQTLVRINSHSETTGDHEYLLVTPSGLSGRYFWSRDDWTTLSAYRNKTLDGTDNTSVTTGLLPNQDLFILANNTGGTAGQFSATEVSIFLLGVAAPSKLTQLDDEWDDYFQSL
jgi:hypothetical protein